MRKLWQKVCCFLLILTVWLMAGCSSGKEEVLDTVQVSEPEKEPAGDVDSGSEDTDGEEESVWVYVCGEVNAPGVYELDAGSRVYEAIEAAGGMTQTAAFSYLNQAELLSDGQKIYVPSEEEVQKGAAGTAQTPDAAPPDDGRVDINTADKEELMSLSGIGEVRAQAIIDYRERQGRFSSIEELKEVEGIKEGTFDKIKDRIKVS